MPAEQDRECRDLMRAFGPRVREQLARHLQSGDELEEVLAITWQRGMRSIRGYRGDAPPPEWLYGIAWRALKDQRRREARRGGRIAPHMPALLLPQSDEGMEERILRALSSQQRLGPVLARLPARGWDVIRLILYEGRARADVAAILQLDSVRASERLWQEVCALPSRVGGARRRSRFRCGAPAVRAAP
jgi:RNA polymerase sigma factor (sigma-70 family)